MQIGTNKTKSRKIFHLLRQIAGAHNSMKVILVPGTGFPDKKGEPGKVILKEVYWYRHNGRAMYTPKCAYIKSTQEVIVGTDFILEFEKLDFKKKGDHKLKIDGREIPVPNVKIATFILKKLPKDKYKYRDVKFI